MKKVSPKRHPGEKQCTGEETGKPQRRSGAWRKRMKNVHRALCLVCVSENSTESRFCTAPKSAFAVFILFCKCSVDYFPKVCKLSLTCHLIKFILLEKLYFLVEHFKQFWRDCGNSQIIAGSQSTLQTFPDKLYQDISVTWIFAQKGRTAG